MLVCQPEVYKVWQQPTRIRLRGSWHFDGTHAPRPSIAVFINWAVQWRSSCSPAAVHQPHSDTSHRYHCPLYPLLSLLTTPSHCQQSPFKLSVLTLLFFFSFFFLGEGQRMSSNDLLRQVWQVISWPVSVTDLNPLFISCFIVLLVGWQLVIIIMDIKHTLIPVLCFPLFLSSLFQTSFVPGACWSAAAAGCQNKTFGCLRAQSLCWWGGWVQGWVQGPQAGQWSLEDGRSKLSSFCFVFLLFCFLFLCAWVGMGGVRSAWVGGSIKQNRRLSRCERFGWKPK